MKNFIKYGAVALAGYLVGFYEMKYKATKALLEVSIKDSDKEEEKVEEA